MGSFKDGGASGHLLHKAVMPTSSPFPTAAPEDPSSSEAISRVILVLYLKNVLGQKRMWILIIRTA
ncbi:unnamed protein product, partial [Gulo gulo]